MKIVLVINSLGLLITATLLYLTIRQVGLILGRLGPIGARSASDVGPRVGENLLPFLADNANLTPKNGKGTLYLFGSDSCGVCVRLRPSIDSLFKYWNGESNIIMVYDGATKNGQDHHHAESGGIPLFRNDTLRQKLGIGFVPFAVMTDCSGSVIGKGVVNDVSHVESLLELKK
jgi:methylamine dehydrogenase accessory protein MauD